MTDFIKIRSEIIAEAETVNQADPAHIDKAADLALKWCAQMPPYVAYVEAVAAAIEGAATRHPQWFKEHWHRMLYARQYGNAAPHNQWQANSLAANMDAHRKRNDPQLQNDPRPATGYVRSVSAFCAEILTAAHDITMIVDVLIPDHGLRVQRYPKPPEVTAVQLADPEKFADCWTIYTADLIMCSSDKPAHPQGVWSVQEVNDWSKYNRHLGKPITWEALPEAVQSAVVWFLTPEEETIPQ